MDVTVSFIFLPSVSDRKRALGSHGMNRALPPRDRGYRSSESGPGRPDIEGLWRALADWSVELKGLTCLGARQRKAAEA